LSVRRSPVTVYIDEEVVKLIDKIARRYPDLPEKLGVDVEAKRKIILGRGVIIECCIKYVYEKVLKPHKHY